MKKILIIAALLLSTTCALGFNVDNETDQTFSVKVIYSDWWFDHTYYVGPADKNFVMTSKMNPDKTSTYIIKSQDKKHKWVLHCSTMARFTLREENGYIRLYIGSIPMV